MSITTKEQFISFLSQTLNYGNGVIQTNKELIDIFIALSDYVSVGGFININGSANLVLATPNGIAGDATLRALLIGDIPNLTADKTTSGTFNIDRLGSGAAADKALYGDSTFKFVTKDITISLPTSLFDVSSGYITNDYTLGATLKSQLANLFFAAPDGSNGSPVFRAISLDDLPTIGFAKGGTGLTTLGAALYLLRVNSLGTALEYVDSTTDNIVEVTNKRYVTDSDLTKLGNITVTTPVNLDTLNSRVNDLDAAVVLQGAWDASVGTFPGAGIAQAGWSYIVSVGGTIDGQVFTANDRIVAILDNASTGTYINNWLKLDYTDAVASLDGVTGILTLGAIIDSLSSKATPVDADYTVINDSAAGNASKKLSWANIKATLKAYYDTFYQVILVSGTNIKTINGTSLLGSGDISVGGSSPTVVSPTQITSWQTDYNGSTGQVITPNCIMRIDVNSSIPFIRSFNTTGFVGGDKLTLINISAYTFGIKANDTYTSPSTPTAAYRVNTGDDGEDIIVPAGGVIVLIYDATSSRLRPQEQSSLLGNIDKVGYTQKYTNPFTQRITDNYIYWGSSGSGASHYLYLFNGRFGVLGSDTGTTTTGTAYLCGADAANWNWAVKMNEIMWFEYCIRFEDLSDGTNTYTYEGGFGDTYAIGTAYGAFGFRYSHGVNGGKFQLYSKLSTETTADSGITVNADTFYRLRAVYMPNDTIKYYINGVYVGTITTDIPTNRQMGWVNIFTKSAGTTNRTLYTDYMTVAQIGSSLG